MKSLHAMIHEFQQPSPLNTYGVARACPGQSQLAIPRLNKRQSQGKISSSTLVLDHFIGPKNPLPPVTQKNIGLLLGEIKCRNQSLTQANLVNMD